MAYESCPECGTRKHKLMACLKCGFQRNRIYRYQNYSVQENGSDTSGKDILSLIEVDESSKGAGVDEIKQRLEKDKVNKYSECLVEVKEEGLQKHSHTIFKSKRKKDNKKSIRLISKRGMKLSGRYTCSNCGNVVDNPTRYAESNQGVVILCASCKSKIRLISFPPEKIDALDFATTGGRFEGNRRKH